VGNAVVGIPTTVTAQFGVIAPNGPNLTATLTVDGQVVETIPIERPANDPRAVETTFEHTFTTAGTTTVAVNGRAVMVIVNQPTANLTIDQVVVEQPTIQAGETVSVIATVRNDGTGEGTMTLEFEAFDEVVDHQNVTVPPDQVRSATFTQRIDAPGTYTLRVNGQAVTVEVLGDAENRGTPVGPTESSGPGFGIVLGLLAFVVFTSLLMRRRQAGK
jgi:hypothetical protein